MTDYKKAILQLVDDISQDYFSVQRTSEQEIYATEIFNKFKYKIINDEDMNILFTLLKVMVTEGVLLNGARELSSTKRDA